VPGTAATWVAPTGTPAARALGCGGRTSAVGAWAWTPCVRGARGGRVRGFLGGALRCLADSESPSKKVVPQKKTYV
jgi:hypothetical protein